MMRKIFHFLVMLAAGLYMAACGEVEPEKPEEEIIEPLPPLVTPEITASKVDGRVALAYVTYYGSEIPDPRVITHINYAFAELYVNNGIYRTFALQGNRERFQKIVALKNENPDLKILLSFTHTVSNAGNSQGGGFSAMAASPEMRKQFAEDCLAFVKENGIDGIDIDWEFPGLSWSGHACNPAVDVDNFTLLMKQLRETLGDDYLLTYAGYCTDKKQTADGWRYIDIAAVDPYVDYVNIMCYDFDEAPHHHSALKSLNAYMDCERAVNAYLKAGVKPEKLVMGIPFYARHAFSGTDAAISYRKIRDLDRHVYKLDNWDAAASVTYISLVKSNTFFAGYDNAESIGIKAEWCLRQGMKGLMYWEYDQDDSVGTLRTAVWNSVMGYK